MVDNICRNSQRVSLKICIKELVDQINISVYHFCRIFKQVVRKTALDYINGIRLEKAAALLKENDLNITEIALRCGFDSINYFSRLFKKYYNTTPTNYREHCRNRLR